MLAIYLTDIVPGLATAKKAAGRVGRLLDWWGEKMLADVTGSNCRKFTADRTPGAARRELQDFQAAINHHQREGYHREQVLVTLPPAGEARERWLTRSEAAKLIWACWRAREMQNGKPTDRMPLRHLARFILFGLYTGSRPGDTLLASYYVSSDRGYVDLEQGLYYRKPPRKRSTNKRQPTTPLPTSLLSHLRRWRERGDDHVVQFNSAPIQSVKTAFEKALKAAKLDETDVIPYTLRHTRATWMKQAGVPSWEVAGYLGTSEAMIEKHYGHHDPNHLKAAANSPQRFPQRNNVQPSTQKGGAA